jgi:PAS domain S-box-containing protein
MRSKRSTTKAVGIGYDTFGQDFLNHQTMSGQPLIVQLERYMDSEPTHSIESDVRSSQVELNIHRQMPANSCAILDSVFQTMTDCVLVWNDTGILLRCSAAAEHMLGYAAGTLSGRGMEAVVRGLVAGNALLQRANGAQMECEAHITRLDEGGGEVTMCVLRRAAEAPFHSETVRGLSRQVVEKLTDVVFQIDRDGNWIFANSAWSGLSGWALHQTLRQSFYRTVAEPHQATVKSMVGDLLAGAKSVARMQVQIITASAEFKWVELALRAAAVGGRIDGVAGTMSDVTDKRAIEQELLGAKQRAEHALTSKDMFLANMSHEIRTPMNAVIALTGLLLETTLSDEQRDFVETIRVSGETLLTLINEILDFSKVENEEFALEDARFNLTEVVEGAMELVSAAPKAMDLELMVNISPSVPEEIMGDPTRLRQILVNLASNAMKFTRAGHVKLSVSVTKHGGEKNLRVDVSDTGIGIPADRAGRLFKPFTQVDASTTRHFGGTGLGLAICRRLVTHMGGHISFDSQVGVGSNFFFEIPLRPALIEIADRPIPAMAGRGVKVIHPYQPAAELIAELLSRYGARVNSTQLDAQVVDESAPNLEQVLCRSPLPSIVTVTKACRATWHPVIAKAKQMGQSVVVVSKPIRPAQLVAAVSSLFADTIRMPSPAEVSGVISLPVDASTLRILVAEDNVVNQKVALAMIAKFGYRADIVSNGVEALVALRSKQYDIVFLDMQMPEMDGLQAARRIVESTELANRPVLIAMTANVSPRDRQDAMAAGCELFVDKPVKSSSLDAAINSARQRLNQRRAQPDPSKPPSARIVDLEQEVGKDLVREIIALFIADAPSRVAALQSGAAGREPIAVSRAAHALRSAALNLGLQDLATRCASVEYAKHDGNVDSVMAGAADIERRLRYDLQALEAYIKHNAT